MAITRKPDRPLPTTRLSVEKQLQLLAAYAANSEDGRKPTGYKDAASLAKMGPNSASLANAFFTDIGFLLREESGKLLPSEEVMDFQRAKALGMPNPESELATLLQHSWPYEALGPLIRMGEPVAEERAVLTLGKVAGADVSKHRAALEMTIEFLTATGLVSRGEGGVLTAGKGTSSKAKQGADRDDATTSAEASRTQIREPAAPTPAGMIEMPIFFDQGTRGSFRIPAKITRADYEMIKTILFAYARRQNPDDFKEDDNA